MLKHITLGALLLAACGPQTSTPKSDYPKVFCGREQLFTNDTTSTQPAVDRVVLDMGTTCWLLNIEETEVGQGGPVTLQRLILDSNQNVTGACSFKGLSNPVRAELSSGQCEFPTSAAARSNSLARAFASGRRQTKSSARRPLEARRSSGARYGWCDPCSRRRRRGCNSGRGNAGR